MVEARGRDFVWHFRMFGPDGELNTADDIDLGQDLHLPAGAQVELVLHSDDLIYTWICPELQVSEIAVPEMTHALQFTATTPGTYDVQVDPLCGWLPLHDDQMGRVVVQSEVDFNAWWSTTARRAGAAD